MNRKAIAQDTVAIGERGTYRAPGGSDVSIADALAACVTATTCYLPEELTDLQAQVLSRPPAYSETRFAVTNETTLNAAVRLTQSRQFTRVGALNFASAKNPGGGFLGGAQAQEESLARSSGLYLSLRQCPEHYEFHRGLKTCLYSDRVIYSPGCPVFRHDDGTLLETPYLVDFLTSPAPNAGAIRKNEPERVGEIAPTLHTRAAKVLALAAHKRCDALILGAWGCGVFRNDPEQVAETWARWLKRGQPFWGRFHTLRFAILDTSDTQATIAPFAALFSTD